MVGTSTSELVVEDDPPPLRSELAEGLDAVMGSAGAAMQRQQREPSGRVLAHHLVPDSVASKRQVALAQSRR